MNLPIRIGLYLVLVLLMGYSLTRFRAAYASQGGVRHEAALGTEEKSESAQTATEPQESGDRKSTRLNSSHVSESRMPSSA